MGVADPTVDVGEIFGLMRLPDFLIIGAMKAGTTSLFRWLGTHPSCALPAVKEPGFFCTGRLWRNQITQYGNLFAGISPDLSTGEASTLYTHPQYAERAASRIYEIMPQARLVFIAREPVARLRSHYRHEVQRGRERRSLVEAVSASNDYVGMSLYFRCLLPYVSRFERQQICVITSDELLTPPYPGWREVLYHIGIPYEEPLGIAFNVTAEKAQFSRPMLWLWEHGVIPKTARVPGPIRRIGKRILLRRNSSYAALMESSEEPLPDRVIRVLENESMQLEQWLGRDLWRKN